jgi:hypothetical protein
MRIHNYLAFNYFKNIFDFEREVIIEWVPLNFIIKDKNPKFKKTKIFYSGQFSERKSKIRCPRRAIK